MTYTTTLGALRKHGACERGYRKISKHVGLNFEGDIQLLTILDNNGFDDCIWAFRAAEGGEELAVRFAISCALRRYRESAFVQWAENWLSGRDRSEEAAEAAAARAAAAVAVAAVAAARAAVAAEAAEAAEAAAEAAEAAAEAAAAAAWAAARAVAEAWDEERKAQLEILRELLK